MNTYIAINSRKKKTCQYKAEHFPTIKENKVTNDKILHHTTPPKKTKSNL